MKFVIVIVSLLSDVIPLTQANTILKRSEHEENSTNIILSNYRELRNRLPKEPIDEGNLKSNLPYQYYLNRSPRKPINHNYIFQSGPFQDHMNRSPILPLLNNGGIVQSHLNIPDHVNKPIQDEDIVDSTLPSLDHVNRSRRRPIQDDEKVQSNSPYQDHEIMSPRLPFQNDELGYPNQSPSSSYQNIETFPRPVDGHLLVRPAPIVDGDTYFDEGVQYNVYRPIPELNSFHHTLTDVHMLHRPSSPLTQSQQYAIPNLENGYGYFASQSNKPSHGEVENRPVTNQNTLQPGHFDNHLPFRPPFPIRLENGIHGNRPNVLMNVVPPIVDHNLGNKPSNGLKPGFVILAENVFINAPREHQYSSKPVQWDGSMHGQLNSVANGFWNNAANDKWDNALRFDHGRDHHAKPYPVSIKNNFGLQEMSKLPITNKDFLTALTTELHSNLSNLSGTIDNREPSLEPENTEIRTSADKEHGTSMEITYPKRTQLGLKPDMIENGGQFHPLLLPRTTNRTPTEPFI